MTYFNIFFTIPYASGLSLNNGISGWSFPGPDLFAPITEDIDLSGKECLEFKWRRTDSAFTRYYDFRLYEGYQVIESSRILKEHINLQDYPFRVDARELQKDKVYTWVLIQVLNDGR
ncbi:MAG: hypothetical protein FJZ12_04000, partial [Candidatus Omnitrophica bacterium]|nr:hypothetical protein [Candidatus Omnitrophota bacterium]